MLQFSQVYPNQTRTQRGSTLHSKPSHFVRFRKLTFHPTHFNLPPPFFSISHNNPVNIHPIKTTPAQMPFPDLS